MTNSLLITYASRTGATAETAQASGQILFEGAAFIQTHRAALSQKPLALFTVCITLAMSNSAHDWSAVAGRISPASRSTGIPCCCARS